LKDKILKELRISDRINKMDRIIWEKSKDRAIGRPAEAGNSVYSACPA